MLGKMTNHGERMLLRVEKRSGVVRMEREGGERRGEVGRGMG